MQGAAAGVSGRGDGGVCDAGGVFCRGAGAGGVRAVRCGVPEEGEIEVVVSPEAFSAAREVLNGLGITEFDTAEVTFLPNEYVEITDPEDKRKFEELCDMLDELQDVQNVYHNVKL